MLLLFKKILSSCLKKGCISKNLQLFHNRFGGNRPLWTPLEGDFLCNLNHPLGIEKKDHFGRC